MLLDGMKITLNNELLWELHLNFEGDCLMPIKVKWIKRKKIDIKVTCRIWFING